MGFSTLIFLGLSLDFSTIILFFGFKFGFFDTDFGFFGFHSREADVCFYRFFLFLCLE